MNELDSLGFWDWVLLWIIAAFAWSLTLGAVRAIGKAWRNE